MAHVQSFVSPKSTRENRNSIATLTLPSTVVVVALVIAMTLLCTQLYTTALQHPKNTSRRRPDPETKPGVSTTAAENGSSSRPSRRSLIVIFSHSSPTATGSNNPKTTGLV